MSAPLFKKVLVANRGEISLRVQQTLREMGIVAVAVYSDPDREALHTIKADEAWPLGPGPSNESYLLIDKVIDAAKKAGVDAIHPGYGFLSENADFARAIDKAGLVFIGPTAESMDAMGNKLAARELMEAAGVPVVPGLTKPVKDPAEAIAAADKIGYPVLLKAAAGGGGKGMRVVEGPEEMASSLSQTQSEALRSFGDDAVFVERFITRPRHIEVQVLGDGKGEVLHLFERECSVQRRHQKVIEESPSPSIDQDLRERLCAAAVEAAKAVNYRGAGTVEFIVDEKGEFFFLEMNTRLQVEHPVTEETTGVDLVRAQVEIAAGKGLRWKQEDLKQRGHSLEFRVYAEDPWHNFAPSLGKVERLRLPQGPGIRNDVGIRPDYQVPIFYDPMLAKLIVTAEDRPAALARARRALADYRLLGFTHNLPLHRWVLTHPEFISGHYSTRFLDDHFSAEELAHDMDADERDALAAALALVRSGLGDARRGAGSRPAELSPWGHQGRRAMRRRGSGQE